MDSGTSPANTSQWHYGSVEEKGCWHANLSTEIQLPYNGFIVEDESEKP